jgi:hypothetical protein
MHLDGKNLAFKQEQQGKHSLSLELEALTSDSNGLIRDAKAFHYNFTLSDQDADRIRTNGIDLNSYLPISNPGDFYVRAAVKDMNSGKIGSGYQFLEIPDLSKRQLSLSSIFVFADTQEASVLKSGDLEQIARGSLTWRALSRSPAVRCYLPGESFEYAAFAYNSTMDENKSAMLQIQTIIYKDGKMRNQGKPEDIAQRKNDYGNVLIQKRLDLDSTMEEGSYTLYLSVKDKQASGKSRAAVQAIDFQIHKE